MNGRWWKAPETGFIDRRLQKLPAGLFRFWFNLHCVAAWSGGALPGLDDLAFLLRTSRGALDRRLAALRDSGLVEGEGGDLVIVAFDGHAGRPEHDEGEALSPAERTRRWRARRTGKGLGDAPVTPARDAPVTPCDGLEEERKEIESQTPRDAGAGDDLFSRFWAAYPSRDGANPIEPARTAFRKALGQGADPAKMIYEAKAYADATTGRDRRYIASATRWLDERRWQDAPPADDTPAAKPKIAVNRDSPAGEAWEAHGRRLNGRGYPWVNGTWCFETEWPADAPKTLEAAS